MQIYFGMVIVMQNKMILTKINCALLSFIVNMNFKRNILQFNKTDHFLLRQWERNIDDRLLRYVLIKLQRKLRDRTNILVTTTTMKQLIKSGIYIPKDYANKNLLIVSHDNTLITTFFIENMYQFMKANYERAHIVFL